MADCPGRGAAVGAEIGFFLYKGKAGFRFPDGSTSWPPGGNVEIVADSLFSTYLLPFEIASLLLLVAVVGSVVMAKKRI